MDNLYIKVIDGQPIKNPLYESNLIAHFGNVPSEYQPFVRVPLPTLDVYQVMNSEEPSYELVDGVWTDVWSVREMTVEEKAAIQQKIKDLWAKMPNLSNFSAWTFDEETCQYIPPIPMPNDNKKYKWDGALNTWLEVS